MDIPNIAPPHTQDKPSVGIDVDRIVSTRIHAKNNTELDVQFMSDILGAPIQNKRYIFSGNEEAIRFQTHLDVMRASGAKLKQIFGEVRACATLLLIFNHSPYYPPSLLDSIHRRRSSIREIRARSRSTACTRP